MFSCTRPHGFLGQRLAQPGLPRAAVLNVLRATSARELLPPVSYVRSALTYGMALCLIGLLLLFFGGLLLSGEAALPGREAGWGRGVPSAAPAQTGLPPATFLPATLCLGLGLLVAGFARAS